MTDKELSALIDTLERCRRILYGVKAEKLGRNDWANINTTIQLLKNMKSGS